MSKIYRQTRPIGDKFNYVKMDVDGRKLLTLEVVECDNCFGCYFHRNGCLFRSRDLLGFCAASGRTDGKPVIFKVESVKQM